MPIDFTPEASPQQPAVDFTPEPKLPDTSVVQKTAAQNLSSEQDSEGETKPQTPNQKLDTALGAPISSLLNPDDTDTPLPAPIRRNLTSAYANGTASNAGDFMQSAIHGVTPLLVGGINRAMHPIDTATNYAGEVAQGATSMVKGAAGLLAYPFLSDENKEELLKDKQLTDYKDPDVPTGPESINRFTQVEQATFGAGMGGLYAPVASLLGPVVNPIIQATPDVVKNAGVPNEYAQTIPGVIGVGMDVLGGLGLVHGAGELNAARSAGTQFKPGTGPWDNHPGKEIMQNVVSKIVDKPPEAVTGNDIEQVIGNGVKNKAPTAQDFHDVSTVTGTEVSTLHIIFNETGVKPDQVFEDAKNNPQIAQDLSIGKIPDAYEHLIEESKIEPEKLSVEKSDTAKAFNVVGEDGEHVQGGFDSAEEARHYIEDKKQETIGDEPAEWANKSSDEGKQTVIPGAEKISDKVLAERNMAGSKTSSAVQKPANEGLFDASARSQGDMFGQKPKGTIPPSAVGRPTSLRTFLSNNGAKFNEANELVSIKRNGEKLEGESAHEYANEIAKDHGYVEQEKTETDLANLLTEKNGGREAFRTADADRVAKAEEAKTARENLDPSKIEHEAHNVGIDTDRLKDESDKQYTARLLDKLREFYKNSEGSGATDAIRKAIGDTIIAAEKFVGKLTGGFFDKLGDAYIKTFAPELVGDKALRADAYLAKFKAAKQEAENAFYRQSAATKAMFDKMSSNQRMEWLYDHETGRWNEEENPYHARYQALLDAAFKAEKEAIGADADKGYKENYLPHAWENPDAVKAFFNSDAMIKKYGKDGFTKASTFKLIQDGVRAGFKLKTDNPESMLVSRLLAGHDMMATMDLLKDFESSGVATKAKIFSIDKRIAKTEKSIAELEQKYKSASDKINDPKQSRWDFSDPAVSKYMKTIESRLEVLKGRLADFNKEKTDNNLSSDQMKDLKRGFKIIGPDSKVWNIHQEVAPLWKNAMESKGLWENQGVVGDAYRFYTGSKAIWTAVKLGASLFHPIHVAAIHLASGISGIADHLIQGGKFSDLATRDTGIHMGITKNTFKLQDHPAVKAWNTPEKSRTPEQKQMVSTMLEGGFKPTMSARDTIHFKENFDKAISGVGLNNLRLLGTVVQLPGKLMAPFFEHWIPGLKSEMYLNRANDAILRDPSLANDAGRRGEVLRQIAKDTDRTYGEMNQDVQFWNKTVRDSFNAAYISGGWKLAQIYNSRGLLQPLNIAYKFAKTGEFSKADITYNMLNAYAYTGLTLALGGAINTMLGNPIGTAKDTVWDMVKNLVFPQTGEKNPDGTPVRLSQPAFAKEAYMLARDINIGGLVSGTGSFLYHQTLIPGIADTLNNRDFIGRKIISNPTDLHQWMNAGYDAISPISIAGYEKAENKGSEIGKIAQIAGFPLAGSYVNQTPFEQKVLATYSEQNKPSGDVYAAKLKDDLKSEVSKGDKEGIKETKELMKKEGMTESQISNAEHTFKGKFVDVAWSKLSAQDQKKLIQSASDEEKKKFRLKQ